MGVTGIGGFMFRANDPQALAAWYADHLGVGGGEHGLWDQGAGPTVFAPTFQCPQAKRRTAVGLRRTVECAARGAFGVFGGHPIRSAP